VKETVQNNISKINRCKRPLFGREHPNFFPVLERIQDSIATVTEEVKGNKIIPDQM